MKRKMKVLLLGEFSGVHNNLKKGLCKLGVDVTLANTGDGFKKFSTDMVLPSKTKNHIRKMINFVYRKILLHKMMDYDVVQFIHPNVLYVTGFTPKEIYKLLRKVKFSTVLLAGCDHWIYKYYGKITSLLCEKCQKIDLKGDYCPFCEKNNPEYVKYEKKFYELVDRIIPIAWEYDYLYREYVKKYNHKLTKMIPMPIDLDSIVPDYTQNDTIKILHPLNRVGAKGTDVIKPAFAILRREFCDKAQFLIKGHMPIDKFNKLVSRQDVIVDQMYGATVGMSSLLSMAQRKVVVTGFHSNKLVYAEYPYLSELPKLDLGTSVDEVIEAIEKLMGRREEIEAIKDAGRAYVEKYHDAKKVAKKYLRIYLGK